MSSTVYGKDRNEPQTLSKVEKGNNLEAEYDVPASVESRSERQTFKRYKKTKLGRRMRWRFGKYLSENETIDNFCYHSIDTNKVM